MGETLTEIAQELKNSPKKVQLIYAFNGAGKTRLSRAFKELVSPKHEEEEAQDGDTGVKVLYYNAFTEDLFYWDNDLEKDTDRKLLILKRCQPFFVLMKYLFTFVSNLCNLINKLKSK